VGAQNAEIGIRLRLLRKEANAEATNVITAAGRHEYGVEVAQADRAVVLENLPLN